MPPEWVVFHDLLKQRATPAPTLWLKLVIFAFRGTLKV